MNYFLFAFLAYFALANLQENTKIQYTNHSQLSNMSGNQNVTLMEQLLAEIPNNNKPIAILNQIQGKNLRKQQEASKDISHSEYKAGKDTHMEEQKKVQKNKQFESKDTQQSKNSSVKGSEIETLKQSQKQKNKQVNQWQPPDNDIKIIPLTAEYGKQKPKRQEKQSISQKSKQAKQNIKRGEVQTKQSIIEKSVESKIKKEKQSQKPKAANESKMIDKLIEDVKNNKDQLHEQSKQEIIQYLENKKQESNLQEENIEIQTSRLEDKDIEEINQEHRQEYALVANQVVEVNQKSKPTKQMDNSTILVIMVLTFIISIPVVREIRSRNDSHKQKHRKDSDTTLIVSKQDVQKSEGQKYYSQINNGSPYQIVQEMI